MYAWLLLNETAENGWSAQPLTSASVDAHGGATYRLRVVDGRLMTRSLEPSSGLLDVYRIQLGVKYSFD